MAAGLLCTAVLVSCAGGKLGYGVVLWSANNSPVKTGQVVTVKSQSQINNTYSIAVSGSRTPIDVPTWRIKLFSSQTEAVNFSASYSPMIPIFAKATTNGTPIRDKPDVSAARVYRLRQGQVIKVLAEQPKKVTIGGIDGHWYQVLTNDGVMGYSFDANLQVYNPANQSQQQASANRSKLNAILSTTYRPQYFQQMIDNNQIDLRRFSPDIGFFADPQAKKVKIVMPKYEITFHYTSIQELAPNDYGFIGTPLEMLVRSPNSIRLTYSDSNGNQYDQIFVKVSQDIGYLVEKVKNQRLQTYTQFLDKTPFSSDYYGKIKLGPNMGFSWTGYSRLVPDIIPGGAGSDGVVNFPLYLSGGLQGQYDGVITFTFGATPGQPNSESGFILAGLQTLTPSSQDVTSSQNASTGSASGSGSSSNGGQSAGGSSQSSASVSGSSSATNGGSGQQSVSFLYSFANGGVKLTYVPPSTVTNDMVTSVSSTPIIIFFSSQASKG